MKHHHAHIKIKSENNESFIGIERVHLKRLMVQYQSSINHFLPLKKQSFFQDMFQNLLKERESPPYQQRYRTYHNISRVYDWITVLDEMLDCRAIKSSDYPFLVLPLFYNRIYFNTKQKDHLKKDAIKSMKRFLHDLSQVGVPTLAVTQMTYLLGQAFHLDKPENDLAKIIQDIDYYYLSMKTSEFLQTIDLIDEEYSNSLSPEYLQQKKNFYGILKQQPSVYYTSYFKAKRESLAQKNIDIALKKISEIQYSK